MRATSLCILYEPRAGGARWTCDQTSALLDITSVSHDAPSFLSTIADLAKSSCLSTLQKSTTRSPGERFDNIDHARCLDLGARQTSRTHTEMSQ